VARDEGGETMRTLYDGTGFEVIREGAVFSDGRFTTRYANGIQTTTNTGTEGSRYRWVGGEAGEARTRVIYEDGYSAGAGRYTGISVKLYGNGEAVAVSRSAGTSGRGGTAYLGKDLLGSVRSTTNETGNLEDRYEYDAFGKPYKGDLAGGMNLGYTGKPYDKATGLYNYGYRDYKPEAARFTTADPVRDGANWFAYVNNDPVNWVDLWGLNASDKGGDKGFWGTVGDFFSGVVDAVSNVVTGLVSIGKNIYNGLTGGPYNVGNITQDSFIGVQMFNPDAAPGVGIFYSAGDNFGGLSVGYKFTGNGVVSNIGLTMTDGKITVKGGYSPTTKTGTIGLNIK
jgi:RHS repeat-associated protein